MGPPYPRPSPTTYIGLPALPLRHTVSHGFITEHVPSPTPPTSSPSAALVCTRHLRHVLLKDCTAASTPTELGRPISAWQCFRHTEDDDNTEVMNARLVQHSRAQPRFRPSSVHTSILLGLLLRRPWHSATTSIYRHNQIHCVRCRPCGARAHAVDGNIQQLAVTDAGARASD